MAKYVDWNWPPTPGPDYRCRTCQQPKYMHSDTPQQNCPLAGGFTSDRFAE